MLHLANNSPVVIVAADDIQVRSLLFLSCILIAVFIVLFPLQQLYLNDQ